jgi:exosortase/archaeosortase family protein
MKSRDVWGLIARYLILIFLGLFNLSLFYVIFTPLTVYPVYWVVSFFESGTRLLAGNMLFFSGLYAQIIPACVAGAAYYLLLIFNLSTPMDIIVRAKSILLIVFAFLLLNVIRILTFAWLLVGGYQYFDLAHNLIWYFGSTIMVVIIWFGNVWVLKIKGIPVFSDMKRIYLDAFGSEKIKKKDR